MGLFVVGDRDADFFDRELAAGAGLLLREVIGHAIGERGDLIGRAHHQIDDARILADFVAELSPAHEVVDRLGAVAEQELLLGLAKGLVFFHGQFLPDRVEAGAGDTVLLGRSAQLVAKRIVGRIDEAHQRAASGFVATGVGAVGIDRGLELVGAVGLAAQVLAPGRPGDRADGVRVVGLAVFARFVKGGHRKGRHEFAVVVIGRALVHAAGVAGLADVEGRRLEVVGLIIRQRGHRIGLSDVGIGRIAVAIGEAQPLGIHGGRLIALTQARGDAAALVIAGALGGGAAAKQIFEEILDLTEQGGLIGLDLLVEKAEHFAGELGVGEFGLHRLELGHFFGVDAGFGEQAAFAEGPHLVGQPQNRLFLAFGNLGLVEGGLEFFDLVLTHYAISGALLQNARDGRTRRGNRRYAHEASEVVSPEQKSMRLRRTSGQKSDSDGYYKDFTT